MAALLSPFIARQRYARIEGFLKGDVLDLGCGRGQIWEKYGSRLNSYMGVEKSPQRIEQLNQKFPNVSFFRCDLDLEPLHLDKKFDCVLMIALIEHLFNQRFVMEGISQVLRPGGEIIITAPTPLGNDLVHRIGASMGLFAKSAVDDHIVLYNRHRFHILANEMGLSLKYHRYFQLFCNQMAVLEKPASS